MFWESIHHSLLFPLVTLMLYRRFSVPPPTPKISFNQPTESLHPKCKYMKSESVGSPLPILLRSWRRSMQLRTFLTPHWCTSLWTRPKSYLSNQSEMYGRDYMTYLLHASSRDAIPTMLQSESPHITPWNLYIKLYCDYWITISYRL